MKPILTRYTIDSMLEKTGDDYNYINLYFKTESRPEITLPFMVRYDDLLAFIQHSDEPAYKYLKKIRSGLHGYGPKHSKIFKIMEDENFDLEPHIKNYLESKDETFIAQHLEWIDNLLAMAEKQGAIEKAAERLSKIVNADYKNYTLRMAAYRDELDQAIHDVTFKYFPELFDKSNKHIAAYRHKLSGVAHTFPAGLDSILHDQFDSYWEEEYEKEVGNRQ